jgi:hypothetical protein
MVFEAQDGVRDPDVRERVANDEAAAYLERAGLA